MAENDTRCDDFDSMPMFPISGGVLHPGGTLEIFRKSLVPGGSGGVRRKIVRLTARARAKLLFTVTECAYYFRSMLTLTYPAFYPQSGKLVKRHLNVFLNWIRRVVKAKYLWFMEFQPRGAPHVHLLLTCEAGDRVEMAKAWRSAIKCSGPVGYWVEWQHRRPATWANVRRQDGAKRYAAKYSCKTRQKSVPAAFRDVGRFWGCSREISNSLPSTDPTALSEGTVRDLLRLTGHRCAGWENLPKYVFGVRP